MFLSDLLVVFAVTAVVVFLFGRAQIPSVIGLLVSGVVVGPYGLSLVDDLESVELLAEIGVVVGIGRTGLASRSGELAPAEAPRQARLLHLQLRRRAG